MDTDSVQKCLNKYLDFLKLSGSNLPPAASAAAGQVRRLAEAVLAVSKLEAAAADLPTAAAAAGRLAHKISSLHSLGIQADVKRPLHKGHLLGRGPEIRASFEVRSNLANFGRSFFRWQRKLAQKSIFWS